MALMQNKTNKQKNSTFQDFLFKNEIVLFGKGEGK